MRNIIFCAQFHELSGYSIAALGYLQALDHYLSVSKASNINLKVVSVAQEGTVIQKNIKSGNISKKNLKLIEKYHIKTSEEFQDICSQTYDLIWQMTSIFPCILKTTSRNVYRLLNISIENLIKGSQNNYHILAWETDQLPSEYLEQINKYKPRFVIAPSEWNRNTFSKDWDSVLVPHIISPSDEVEGSKISLIEEAKKDNKFIILSVSEWTNRKNFRALIRSYISQFYNHNDTLLVIKTTIPPFIDREKFAKEIKAIKDQIRVYSVDEEKKNNIAFILDYLSDDKINYLYKSCDLYALTSFGEGFSLPTSRAAAEGKAIMCPNRGGHVDYISKNNPFFIETIKEAVFDHSPYDFDGNWYYPSERSIMKNLKQAYSLWKTDISNFKKIGKDNAKTTEKFDLYTIGSKLIEVVESSPKKSTGNKISSLKKSLANAPLQQKIDKLKDQYKNEECFILNCGPSLLEHEPSKLKELLKNELVFTIKQAYELFSEISDFHFFNCSNLPQQENLYSGHYRNNEDCIFVASSNYEEYQRWNQLQTNDIFFKIPIRTEINNEFLTRTGDIDKYLLKNNLTRPCGPGIMYETVLFMAIHLGVRKITCLGWDLSQDKVNENTYKHFYGNTTKLKNRGDILEWEIEETKRFSLHFFNWLKDKGIELRIASKNSYLPSEIPRIELLKTNKREKI